MIGTSITTEDQLERLATGMEYAGPETNDMLCEYKIMRGGYRFHHVEERDYDGEKRLMKIYRRKDKEIGIGI